MTEMVETTLIAILCSGKWVKNHYYQLYIFNLRCVQRMVHPDGNYLIQRCGVDELPVGGVESPEGAPDEHADGEGETGEEEILKSH